MYNSHELDKLAKPFKELISNQGLNYQLLDLHPIPIEIFTPDGMCIFANKAVLELNNIPDADYIVGKYNYNEDQACFEILGQDVYDRLSRGEAVSFPDFPAPPQDVVARGVLDIKPWEAATLDLFFLPLWEQDEGGGARFVCTVLFYTVKNMYQGRADIIRAEEYIKENWLEKFDLGKTALAANLSKRHLQRVFKDVTGTTPNEYYQDIKLEKIKEKLLDENLSVEQVFKGCGVEIHGAYHKLFKKKTGMSPSEYRKANIRN